MTSNLFLAGLSAEARHYLVEEITETPLPSGKILYEEETVPRYAYFLTSGLASVVTPMADGKSAEVGFIGHEGVVGSLHLLGRASMATRSMMQLPGSGITIPFVHLQEAFNRSPEIHNRLLEFVQEQAIMVGQIAGCNRLHDVTQRLTRWLLMAQDRAQTDTLEFTQEFLADMIGTRRTTITVLAANLKKQGLMTYSRGRIQLEDRAGLEAVTCECYRIIHNLHRNLYSRSVTKAE